MCVCVAEGSEDCFVVVFLLLFCRVRDREIWFYNNLSGLTSHLLSDDIMLMMIHSDVTFLFYLKFLCPGGKIDHDQVVFTVRYVWRADMLA